MSDVIAAIAAVPLLELSAPTAVTVGGAAGQQFVLTVSRAPADHVIIPGLYGHFNLDPGDQARLQVVDVSGRTVVIVAAAAVGQGGELAAFLPRADEIIATVRWGG